MTAGHPVTPPAARRRSTGRGTIALIVVLGIAGLAAAAFVALRYLPLIGHAQDLRATAGALADEMRDLTVADLDTGATERIAGRLADLEAHLAPFQDLLAHDPVVAVARAVPGLGDQVTGADRLVEAADRLVEAGHIGVTLAERFRAVRQDSAADPTTGVMGGLVELMATSTGEVDRMAALLGKARAELAAVPAGVIGPIADARDRMTEPLDRYAPLLDDYRDADDTLASLLGWEAPRRYLVLAQNPAELRPTGGYTGTVGIIGLDKGRPVEQRFFTVYALDLKEDTPWVQPPDALVDHLLGDDQAWRLADANWSPDFPTSAQQASELYSLESGEAPVDGVIGVTTYALDRLLGLTGPVEVPDFGVTVAPGDVTMTILGATRPGTRDEAERKAVLDALAETTMDRLLALPTDAWPRLLEVMQGIGRDRLALAWFRDPEAEALVRDAGWSGEVRADPGDYLSVVEANMAPTSKYNLVVERRSSLDVDLAKDGSASSSLRLDWQNDADREGEPYASIRSYSTSEDGLYGAYVRVLVPQGADLVLATGRDTDRITGAELVEPEAGRTAFGNYLLMAPGASTLTYLWSRDGVATQEPDGTWTYRLTIQKQPGAAPEPMTVAIRLPAGATVTSASGGLTVDGDRVTLETDLTRDAELEVRYALPQDEEDDEG